MSGHCTGDTEHEGPVVEIDAATFERFEEERQKTKTDYAPEMDPSTFLSALLDTQQAVREGYYERSVDTGTERSIGPETPATKGGQLGTTTKNSNDSDSRDQRRTALTLSIPNQIPISRTTQTPDKTVIAKVSPHPAICGSRNAPPHPTTMLPSVTETIISISTRSRSSFTECFTAVEAISGLPELAIRVPLFGM